MLTYLRTRQSPNWSSMVSSKNLILSEWPLKNGERVNFNVVDIIIYDTVQSRIMVSELEQTRLS
jgi:hypothetical protein